MHIQDVSYSPLTEKGSGGMAGIRIARGGGYSLGFEYKNTTDMANIELSEQERIRRESLAKLRELGINPYPAPLYPVNATAK